MADFAIGSVDDPDFRLVVRLSSKDAPVLNLVQCRHCPDVYAVPQIQERLFREVHHHKKPERHDHGEAKE